MTLISASTVQDPRDPDYTDGNLHVAEEDAPSSLNLDFVGRSSDWLGFSIGKEDGGFRFDNTADAVVVVSWAVSSDGALQPCHLPKTYGLR